MRKIIRVHLLCISLLLLLGCSPVHNPGAGQNKPLGKLEAEFSSLNLQVIGPKCVSCHSGSNAPHGIDLSSYEKIIDSNLFPPLVVPGDPEQSSLYTSVKNNSMPENRAPLTDVEKRALYDWILNGALKEPVADPGGGGGGSGEPEEPEPCEPGEPCEEPEEPCEPGEPCEEPELPCEPGEPC